MEKNEAFCTNREQRPAGEIIRSIINLITTRDRRLSHSPLSHCKRYFFRFSLLFFMELHCFLCKMHSGRNVKAIECNVVKLCSRLPTKIIRRRVMKFAIALRKLNYLSYLAYFSSQFLALFQPPAAVIQAYFPSVCSKFKSIVISVSHD